MDIELRDREEPWYMLLRLRRHGSKYDKVHTQDYPISGFPRKFMVEDENNGENSQFNFTSTRALNLTNSRSIKTAEATSRAGEAERHE